MEMKSLEHDYQVLYQTLLESEKELEMHQRLNIHYVEHIKLMGEVKFSASDTVSGTPTDEKEQIKAKNKLKELEEENRNLAKELEKRTVDLEMIMKQVEHYKEKLGLPAEATISDIQDKIEEMAELGGMTADLEKEVEELKRQRATIERNITELQRQQKRIEFETRNAMAKNTRLTGRRTIQPVYMPGARAGLQHQFMVLPSVRVKEAIPPDFTLKGAKPRRPGSNTAMVPPIKPNRSDTITRETEPMRIDSITFGMRKEINNPSPVYGTLPRESSRLNRSDTQLNITKETEPMRTDSITFGMRKEITNPSPVNETPTRENSGRHSGGKTSTRSSSPMPSYKGKRGFLPFFCILCRKQITDVAADMPCILHPQPARNNEYMCCKGKTTNPGCCTVQHCFIVKDESNANVYMKTSNGKYSMAIHFTSPG